MHYLSIFIKKLVELNKEDLLNYTQKEVPAIFYLNLSVLAGEYYNEGDSEKFYSEWDNEIKRLNVLLKSFIGKVFLIDKTTVAARSPIERAKIRKLKELHQFFSDVTKLYFKLVHKAERDFTNYGQLIDLYNDYEVFEINLIEEINKHRYDLISNSEDFEYDIFQINIKLAEIDINLDCDEDLIKKLIGYRLFLERHLGLANTYTNFIVELLLDKCGFFLAKIYMRKQKQAVNDQSVGEESYYREAYDKLYKQIKYYKGFLDKSVHHYFGMTESLVNSATKSRIVRKDVTLELHQIHDACKSFRSSNDFKKLNILSEIICQKRDNISSFSYDEFAVASAKNLINNAKIRITLAQEREVKFKNIIKKLREGNQDSLCEMLLGDLFTNSKDEEMYIDYYPYSLVLSFLSDLLDHVVSSPLELLSEETQKDLREGKSVQDAVQKIKEPKGAMAVLREMISYVNELYVHAYKICHNKKYKPIYLSYEESLIQINEPSFTMDDGDSEFDGNIKLFAESAHVLPDDYQRIKDAWRTIKRRLDDKIILLRSTLDVVTQVNFYEKSFKKEVENKEFKLVQALAMFIAIATLILGSIKATENRSVTSSVVIIFSLGCVLMLFNYFMYWFIRSDTSIKAREIILLIFIAACAYSTYSISTKNDDQKNLLKYRTDSLNMMKANDTVLYKFFHPTTGRP